MKKLLSTVGNTIKRIPVKYLVVIILVLLCAFFAVFDTVRAGSFSLEIISADPSPVKADGESTCNIVVKLTDRKGNALKGHDIFVLQISGGGNFSQLRNTTDELGQVYLNFRPLRASKYNPAQDVLIEIYDESNSVFFMIHTKIKYTIKVETP